MLGLYIHIPFCVQKCKYCDFNSYKIEKDKKEKFLNDLKKEMSLYTNKDRNQNQTYMKHYILQKKQVEYLKNYMYILI